MRATRISYYSYTFEHSECTSDMPSLPTIKVHVSPARKKSMKRDTGDAKSKRCKVETEDDAAKRTKKEKSPDRTTSNRCNRLKKTPEKPTQTSSKKIETPHATATKQEDQKKKRNREYELFDDLENSLLEEYIPDAPKRPCSDFKYVPSRKSMLETMQFTLDEYTPTLCDNKHAAEIISYVPNPIEKLEASCETYEPCATTIIPDGVLEKYVPNSKGVKSSVEEYEPDFKSPSKLMKFDDSYVPSSVRQTASSEKTRTPEKLKLQRLKARRKGTPTKKKMDLFS